MDKKRKNVVLGIVVSVAVVLLIVFGTLACLGVFRGFNAQGYVSAILDQTIKGNVEVAAEMTEGTTEEALLAQYDAGIESFVKNTLLNKMTIDSELEEKYIALCKKIFAKLDYSVQEAEKVSDDEFHVLVKYRPTNIMNVYVEAVNSEVQRANEKKEKGEYRGTYEEIFAQMTSDTMANAYTALEEAYNNMEFGEEQKVIFNVIKEEDGLYKLEESSITKFLVKILSLDVKQY